MIQPCLDAYAWAHLTAFRTLLQCTTVRLCMFVQSKLPASLCVGTCALTISSLFQHAGIIDANVPLHANGTPQERAGHVGPSWAPLKINPEILGGA